MKLYYGKTFVIHKCCFIRSFFSYQKNKNQIFRPVEPEEPESPKKKEEESKPGNYYTFKSHYI